MKQNVTKLEKSNMIELEITVPAEEFDSAIDKAYQKMKNRFKIDGFRKGKIPKQVIVKMYGIEVFYEEAANILIPKAYDEVMAESDLDVVSRPDIEVKEIGQGKDFVFTATVAVKPEVKLGDYKSIEFSEQDLEVSDKDLEDKILSIRKQHSRKIKITDRAVENGDTVTIDFEGFIDNEPFEGGKGLDYQLEIGSHTFIDNFEEQLIGKNIGDDVEVNVTFPKDYHKEELAEKPALFKVKIKSIEFTELPEFNEELLSDISEKEDETIESYKETLKEQIKKEKEAAARYNKEEELLNKLVAMCEIDIPEAMLNTQVNNSYRDFVYRLQQQGLSIEQYEKYTGMTRQSLAESMKVQAEQRIRTRLILEAIAKEENIEVTDEELLESISMYAMSVGMTADKLKEEMSNKELENAKLDVAVKKVVDKLLA